MSNPGSCASGRVVLVKRAELQEMLNDFQQRLIRDENIISAKLASRTDTPPPNGG